MSVYANSAVKCFEQNLQQFGDRQNEPEKYNLYNGLGNLAHAVRSLEEQLEDILRKIAALR